MKYEPHPESERYPLMDERSAEFKAFVEDIRRNGLREPIVLLGGKILDGRNRYLGCQRAGALLEETRAVNALLARWSEDSAVLAKAAGKYGFCKSNADDMGTALKGLLKIIEEGRI